MNGRMGSLVSIRELPHDKLDPKTEAVVWCRTDSLNCPVVCHTTYGESPGVDEDNKPFPRPCTVFEIKLILGVNGPFPADYAGKHFKQLEVLSGQPGWEGTRLFDPLTLDEHSCKDLIDKSASVISMRSWWRAESRKRVRDWLSERIEYVASRRASRPGGAEAPSTAKGISEAALAEAKSQLAAAAAKVAELSATIEGDA